jgi:hypothetical protein
MNPEAVEMLETLLKMDKSMLNEEQAGFIRARRSYLNDEQRARFADIIGEEKPAKKKKGEDE